ncbi:MAG: DUF3791 domain-containing protein [Bacteroidales bacterium]|nr:DUF3791 domain-containing protein [Bacteroidales bacterium]
MTEESRIVFRGDKAAEIIESISSVYGVSLEQATDIFYNSETSVLIEEGIADLHCRSARYLAQCVWEEYKECAAKSV